MQSNKTSSRKPREASADVAGQLPAGNAAAPVTKARKPTASASLKKTPEAAASAKRHRKTATAVSDAVAAPPIEQVAQAEVGQMATAPRAMAAASGASFNSDAVGTVGNMTEPLSIGAVNAPATERQGRAGVTPEDVAELAHSYWVNRGYQHGSHDEDWLRAEKELNSRR